MGEHDESRSRWASGVLASPAPTLPVLRPSGVQYCEQEQLSYLRLCLLAAQIMRYGGQAARGMANARYCQSLRFRDCPPGAAGDRRPDGRWPGAVPAEWPGDQEYPPGNVALLRRLLGSCN
ncbi:hypothetical protein Thini_0067, partial [Thiothrix nivea DSM 5205]